MKRKLVLLNLVLLALAAAAGWQLRVSWLAGQAQQRKVLRQPAGKADGPVPAAPRPVAPVSASSYGEVAQKTLFSEDRNPNVIVEVAAPKPVPAFPAAYGIMDFGGGPMVFLSEKPGAQSRGYSTGEKVGEFTLAAVSGDEIVFEWGGRKFPKKLHELKPVAAAPAAQATGAAAPAAKSVAVAVEAAPGQTAGGEVKSCVPGDTSPSGAVRDGYRKVVTQTPFGSACHWEPVKQ